MPALSQRRTPNGQFDGRLTDDELLDAVARFARASKPADPAAVSQRAWDAQKRVSGEDEMPTARAIYMRFAKRGVAFSWTQLVETALKPQRERDQTLVAAAREDEGSHLTAHHVHYAVSAVARGLGSPPATPDDYARGRDHRLAGSGSACQVARLRLPTANQLIRWARARTAKKATPSDMEAWQVVLTTAGVAPIEHEHSVPTGMPGYEAVALFVRLNHAWPSRAILMTFAREAGIPLTRETQRHWRRQLDQAAALLAAEGVELASVAPAPRSAADRPSWVFPINGAAAFARADDWTQEWSTETIVEKLAAFDRVVPAREGRTQATYRRHLPDHPDWPHVSRVIARGGWTANMRSAQALNRCRPIDQRDTPSAAGAPVVIRLDSAAPDTGSRASAWRSPDRTYEDLGAGLVRSSPKPPLRRRQRSGPEHKVTISQLISSGALNVGERLTARHMGKSWTATVGEDGSIEVTGLGSFASLTAAGMACIERATNGWEFWRVQRAGLLVRLSALRRRPAPMNPGAQPE